MVMRVGKPHTQHRSLCNIIVDNNYTVDRAIPLGVTCFLTPATSRITCESLVLNLTRHRRSEIILNNVTKYCSYSR